jgi:hypothetical protein
MSVRRPVLTPDHPMPVAAAHRQAGYPHSLAGTTASDHHPPMANVVPITAGFVLFGHMLPHGIRAGLPLAVFACLVASAVALGRQQTPGSEPR